MVDVDEILHALAGKHLKPLPELIPMSSHGFAGKVDVSKRALVGGDALGDTLHDGVGVKSVPMSRSSWVEAQICLQLDDMTVVQPTCFMGVWR